MRWYQLALVCALCPVILPACGAGTVVDLEAVPLAKAGCEAPTAAQLRGDALMLPGRDCQRCHVPGGQAASVRLTISGTLLSSLTSPCNSGGVSGAKVEILDMNDKVQATLTSNAAGNFYTADAISFPIRARISKDGVTREMKTPTSIGSCASCHQKEPKFLAEGVLYLR